MDNNISLTPQEVADILKITKNTVYELVKRGELNGYKVGKKIRIDTKDVNDYRNSSKRIKTPASPISEYVPKPVTNPLSYMDSQPENGFVICGQEMLLDILAMHFENHPNGTRCLRSYIGSYNGLYQLYMGKVNIATAHIWDGDTNDYNTPSVKHCLPGIPAIIFNLTKRMQGFYVKKGNPKGITGWDDLKREDITLINREKGSGTRILLDEHLRLMNVAGGQISGYNRESLSHLAIASTVARGGADIGMGTQKFAMQVPNIDFIPLQEERYDIIIKKEDLHNPYINAVIEILQSTHFKNELLGIGGYDISNLGKVVSET